MPKILEINGFKFYLYTDDHLPIHVHVKKSGSETKIILLPEVMIKDNYGMRSKELRQIINIIENNFELLIDKWHEIHS